MEDKITFLEMVVAIVTIISSAAGLRLFKLFYKWSYERRKKLREEWRGDLLNQLKALESEIAVERKEKLKIKQKLTEALIDNAVLQEKLKNL